MADDYEAVGAAISAHSLAATARYVALAALRQWVAADETLAASDTLRRAAEAMIAAEDKARAADERAGRALPTRVPPVACFCSHVEEEHNAEIGCEHCLCDGFVAVVA